MPRGHGQKTHWWSDQVHNQQRLALRAKATVRDIVRLEAQLKGQAGAWMSAPPAHGLGLAVDSKPYSLLL